MDMPRHAARVALVHFPLPAKWFSALLAPPRRARHDLLTDDPHRSPVAHFGDVQAWIDARQLPAVKDADG
jgi:hypothetical protein